MSTSTGSRSRRALLGSLLATGLLLTTASHDNPTADAPASFDFRYDVQPVFERLGCSSAYCHGAATGRGGFKLSLFGSDPAADYREITQEFDGRRVDFVDAGKSLLLHKPSMQITHGGGHVLDKRGADYARLEQWITDGAKYRKGSVRELTGLRLEQRDGRVAAIAQFRIDDQSVDEDVTALTKFWSSNDEALAVAVDGTTTAKQAGEAWVFARYGGRTARLVQRKPFDPVVRLSGEHREDDTIWHTGLTELGLVAGERTDQFTLMRRVYLDLAGRPPTTSEIERWFSLKGKRVEDAVERLVATPEFADVFARHLQKWFEIPEAGRNRDNVENQLRGPRTFLRELVADNRPLSDLAGELVTGGRLASLMRRHPDPRDRSEFVGRTLLGTRIGCARCHDHPLDRWSRTEHLSFSALFVDDRPKAGGGMKSGVLFHPVSGKPVAPKLLPVGTGTAPASDSHGERLRWFIVEGGHDKFARRFANAVFSALIGRGFVEPLDDHRLTNPAVHGRLLDYYTQVLRDSGYDLRRLVRAIVTSDLYAATSEVLADTTRQRIETRYLARRPRRSLTAFEVRRASAAALGVSAKRNLLAEAPLAFTLEVVNGDLIPEMLQRPGNQVDAIFEFGGDAKRLLNDLYELILTRQPRDKELAALVPRLDAATDKLQFGRDLAFALLASREFGTVR